MIRTQARDAPESMPRPCQDPAPRAPPAPGHPQHADDVSGLIQLHVALCRQYALHCLQDAGCHGDIAADKHVASFEAQHAVHLGGQLCPQDVLYVGLRGGGVRVEPGGARAGGEGGLRV